MNPIDLDLDLLDSWITRQFLAGEGTEKLRHLGDAVKIARSSWRCEARDLARARCAYAIEDLKDLLDY